MGITLKKYNGKYMFGVCGYGGETNDSPLTWYARTKEWLCPYHLRYRQIEKIAENQIKKYNKEKEMWDRIRAI